MSQEESHALGQITRDVALLAQSQQGFRDTVEKAITAMGAQIADARTETRDLARAFTESRQFGWQKALSIGGALIGLCTVAGTIISLQTSAAIAPLVTQGRVVDLTMSRIQERQEKIDSLLLVGKEARLEEKREQAVRNAVQDASIGEDRRRTAELWQEVFRRPMATR